MIQFISLVPKGANRFATILKDDGGLQLEMLVKENASIAENGELVAVVYAPEIRDSHGDIAGQEVIKEAMYDAAQRGVLLDVRHSNVALPRSEAYIAEQFIIQPGDPRFSMMKDYDGQPVDVTGGWGVVIKLVDQELRHRYASGEWQGVSMGGQAVRDTEKQYDEQENMTMTVTLEQMNAALAVSNDKLVGALSSLFKSVTEEIAKAMKPSETKKEDRKKYTRPAPIFKGDVTDDSDVESHQRSLGLWEIAKDADLTTGEGVAEYRERLQAFEATHGEMSEGEKAYVSGRPLKKAPAASNVGTEGDGEFNWDDDVPADTGKGAVRKSMPDYVTNNVQKSGDLEAARVGRGLARYINGR